MGRKVVLNDFENPSMHHRMYHVQTLITWDQGFSTQIPGYQSYTGTCCVEQDTFEKNPWVGKLF